MAYATSNPPNCVSQGIGGGRKLWIYASTDAATVVRVTGYITNAQSLGMLAGDIVIQIDTDASPIASQIMIMSVINSNGSGDLSDGTAIVATNTD